MGARCNVMKLIKSKLLSHKFEETIILNCLRPVIILASETWSLTKGNNERLIIIFKKNALINMYGSSYNLQVVAYLQKKKKYKS